MQPTSLNRSTTTIDSFSVGVSGTDSTTQWSLNPFERYASGTSSLDVFELPSPSLRPLEIKSGSSLIGQNISDLIDFYLLGQVTRDIKELHKLYRFSPVEQEDALPSENLIDDDTLSDEIFVSKPLSRFKVRISAKGVRPGKMSKFREEDVEYDARDLEE